MLTSFLGSMPRMWLGRMGQDFWPQSQKLHGEDCQPALKSWLLKQVVSSLSADPMVVRDGYHMATMNSSIVMRSGYGPTWSPHPSHGTGSRMGCCCFLVKAGVRSPGVSSNGRQVQRVLPEGKNYTGCSLRLEASLADEEKRSDKEKDRKEGKKISRMK